MVSEIVLNQFLQGFISAELTAFFQIITLFGHPIPWFFVGSWLYWLGKERKSVFLISVITLAALFSSALKVLVRSPRPTGLVVLEMDNSTFSMPSSHATIAGSVYGFFEKTVKLFGEIFLLALVLLVAVSRLYLGVHFLSDVIVGLLLGYLIVWLIIRNEASLGSWLSNFLKAKWLPLLMLLFLIGALLLLVLPEELYGAYAFLGYYTGFLVQKKENLKLKQKKKIANLVFGTLGLGLVGLGAYLSTGLISIGMFFVAGLFVTLIWPIIISRIKL